MRYLLRVGDGETFAYAKTRRDYFLVSDDSLWAHESHALLLSAGSGAALARRVAHTYYDSTTGEALYREAAEPSNGASVDTASATRRRRRH